MKLKNMIKSGLVAGLLAAVVCACGGAGSVANDGGSDLPGIPAGVTASQGTITDSVLVKWDVVDNAGYYVVYKAIDTPESFKVIADRITELQFSDTDVNKGQVYYYKVAAGRGNSWSAPGGAVSGFLQDNTPVPPQNVQGPGKELSDCAIGSITVTWDQVDAAQRYIVLRSEHKYGGYAEVATVTDGTSYKDTSVSADTIYWYKIVSVNNEDQQGVPSEPVNGLARQQVPVWDAAAEITATDNYINKIQVTWTAATYAATYSLYRSDSTEPIATGITDLTYDDRGYAAADTEYTYTVVAVSTGGPVTLGDTDTGRTLTDGGWADPVDPPTGVVASKGKTNLITITWNAEQDAAAYTVYRNTVNDPDTAVIVADKITTLSYDNAMVPFVPDRTTYYYWVTAWNASTIQTDKSSVASGYANPDKPGVPVIATPDIDDEGSITISWSAADTWTKRYTVYRSDDGGETYNIIGENQSETSITEYLATQENGTVQAGVTYYYRVKAINDVGESAQSDGIAATFALKVPANLSVSTSALKWHWEGALWCSYYTYTVTWAAVKGASGYEVGFYYSKEWHSVTITNGSTTSLTWDTLKYGGNGYDVRIRAINATPDPDIYSDYYTIDR